MIQALFNKLGHMILTLLVFIYIIFEELVWETIAKPIYNFVHSLKILQKVEYYIHALHRYVLLGLFLILFIKVELLGIAAVTLLAKGQVTSGVLLYLGKIPIGAFTFWLFRISKDKLMSFQWFKTLYDFMMRMIEKIKASDIYHQIKIKTTTIKVYIKEKSAKFKQKYFSKESTFQEKIKKIYLSIKKIFQ
ncbi:MAG: hypothetical protein K0U47_11810 [Epsilonproteobacteria bacterium]|nr:hypothetical protein [Campylobacterota bacterium]